jgi:hypothetical protein
MSNLFHFIICWFTFFRFWDVCQIIARERKIRDVDEDRGLQVIKVVTYILLFCILLWCAVAQKLSLVVLVSPVIDRTKDNSVSDVEVGKCHIMRLNRH